MAALFAFLAPGGNFRLNMAPTVQIHVKIAAVAFFPLLHNLIASPAALVNMPYKLVQKNVYHAPQEHTRLLKIQLPVPTVYQENT